MWKKQSTYQCVWCYHLSEKENKYINNLYMYSLEGCTKYRLKTGCEENGWLGDRDFALYVLSYPI